MSFIGDLKTTSRRALHARLAVDATYIDSTMAEAVPVKVRSHNKTFVAPQGDNPDYADILATIDRLVFQDELLAADEVTLRRGGIVTIPEYGAEARYMLDSEAMRDGPLNVYWNVAWAPEAP